MNQFLACMKEMASDISVKFSTNKLAIATEPTIKKEVYESATLMVMDKFKAFKIKQPQNSNTSIHVVPSSKCVNATEAYCKTLTKTIWKSFDEYIVHGYQQFYTVKLSFEKWKTESSCTCPAFFKHHMCKHIVAVGIRSNIIDNPQADNTVRLVPTKRKPGRAAHATRALLLQP